MIIKTLVENTAINDSFNCQHGLSLYIETGKHKLLFDLGVDGLFLENARKLDVDIADVDIVVISHGHYDHGGGLKTFLQENKKAKIYIHKKAFNKYYSRRDGETFSYIGLDEELKNSEQIIFTDGYIEIDKGLELFSGITARKLSSKANEALFMGKGDRIIEDLFEHEQNLIITEDGKTLLLAGCAHNGIVNILDKFIDIKDREPDYTIGGFHLYNRNAKKSESIELITGIADYLKETKTIYYTCHCTGLEPFTRLKHMMGEQVQYLSTGTILRNINFY